MNRVYCRAKVLLERYFPPAVKVMPILVNAPHGRFTEGTGVKPEHVFVAQL